MIFEVVEDQDVQRHLRDVAATCFGSCLALEAATRQPKGGFKRMMDEGVPDGRRAEVNAFMLRLLEDVDSLRQAVRHIADLTSV